MTNSDDGGTAFPCAGSEDDLWQSGMMLRDWFAGKALAGLAVNNSRGSGADKMMAEQAYRIADAMLKAR